MATWWGALALVAIVVLAVGVAQTSFGRQMLRKAGLLEESASYTSLAFGSPHSRSTTPPAHLMTTSGRCSWYRGDAPTI
jgi:hypothetical protein